MKRSPGRNLFSVLFLSNFILAGSLLVGIGWYTLDALKETYQSAWIHQLQQSIDFVERRLPTNSTGELTDSLFQQEFHQLRDAMSVRVTLMDSTGRVFFETDTTITAMQNHGNRPEFQDALRTGEGHATRYSETVSRTMLYVARKVQIQGHPVVIRAATPLRGIESKIDLIYRKWIIAIGIAILLGAILAYLVSSRIVAPIRALREGAERFAEGNLEQKLPLSSWSEVHSLADSLNRMAEQLNERIHSIGSQKNETEAILSSLQEGVVALDHRGTVLRFNIAFSKLFPAFGRQILGRNILELIRNTELDHLLQTFHIHASVFQKDLLFVEGEQVRTLLVRGSTLRDSLGMDIGTLLVFHDVSRIRQLEEMRSDFVANVSHELKTPITSIKGYVETLQGMPLEGDPDASKFLDTVSRQADRLNAIVDDLLTLSRIEQDGHSLETEFQWVDVEDLVESVVQAVEPLCQRKEIRIDREIPPALMVWGNPGLLEQALLNLVSNACKYSDDQKRVLIQVTQDTHVVIRVQDQGFGIERKNLPRIFERFYRVDKARSRSLGGTGLGLAIAKNILILHHGRIDVESTVGEGSVFTLVLPIHSAV